MGHISINRRIDVSGTEVLLSAKSEIPSSNGVCVCVFDEVYSFAEKILGSSYVI